jgi:hypothetical protein
MKKGGRVGMLLAFVLSPGEKSSVILFEAGQSADRLTVGPKQGVKVIRDNQCPVS